MKLGVIGSMVWDTIYGRDARTAPFEEWGGIAYALAALEVALPPHWELVPLVRVGTDLAPQANAFLTRLTRRAAASRFIEVPAPTNRVTLTYASMTRRSERLAGGVPAWRWDELGPLIRDCDALYVNFISGFEMDLETAERLRAGYDGPIFADLHSLLLGLAEDGRRFPAPLTDADRWFACFDALQMNEEELALMHHDPMAVAARALAAGVGLLVVTLGPRGAVWFLGPDWRFHPRGPATAGPVATGRVAPPDVLEGDPTGCGDVFGATLVARLLAGDTPADGLRAANTAAARNVSHRGASFLQFHLRGEIAPA